MALEFQQLKNLREGNVTPTDSQIPLSEIVRYAAVISAYGFLSSHKRLPPTGEELANEYMSKMFSVCKQINQGDGKTFTRVLDVFLARLHSEGVTYSGVTNNNTEGWFSFAITYMIPVFEALGGVKLIEADAYEQYAGGGE